VSARQDPDLATDRVIANLPAYLAGYLLDYGESLENLPEPQLAGATVMWATGTQSVRPDQRAQQWIRRDDGDDEDSPWTLAGIERNGEFVPTGDSPTSGGVQRFTTGPVGLDPPD
jgi:hypothetical protein